MCGIVGIISKRANGLYMKDMDDFESMLVTDTQRGLDSTGVFSAHRDGAVNIVKVATHPLHLFLTAEWNKWKSAAMLNANFIVGHNRKATQGAINSENAHPFSEGNYVLIHNGTLRNHAKWKTGKEVDSHAICAAFNERGHEEVLKEIEGAFALVFYNIETEKLYMIRNTERPLSLVIGTDIISFASEAWMAAGQMGRTNQKIEEIHDLVPSYLYEFDSKGAYTSKKVELFKEPVSTTYYGGNGRYRGNSVYGTAFDWDSVEDPLDRPVLPHEAKILQPFASAHLFPKGRLVQATVGDLTFEWNNKLQASVWKVSGYIDHPRLPQYDCIGYLPLGTTVTHPEGWKKRNISATVESVWTTICGPSVNLLNIELDEEVQVHGDKVGAVTYRELVRNESCTGCMAAITWKDAPFTSVSLRKEKPMCLCPDCLELKLKGEFKDDFIKKRSLAAVQDGKQQRQGTDEHAESVILLPSPASLQ